MAMTKAKENPRIHGSTPNHTYIGEPWAWKRIFDAAAEKNETKALGNIMMITRLGAEMTLATQSRVLYNLLSYKGDTT